MNTHALRTERLELEPIRAAHAEEVWPVVDDERMWRYFPTLRPATIDDLRRTYERWERGSPDPSLRWENWLCRATEGGVPVGAMQASLYLEQRVAYIAYAIYPAYQRRGYAYEASSAVIAHLRDEHGIERIYAEMDARNEPSYELAESLGFSRVERRESVERGHGLIADEYVYELRTAHAP